MGSTEVEALLTEALKYLGLANRTSVALLKRAKAAEAHLAEAEDACARLDEEAVSLSHQLKAAEKERDLAKAERGHWQRLANRRNEEREAAEARLDEADFDSKFVLRGERIADLETRLAEAKKERDENAEAFRAAVVLLSRIKKSK